MLLYIHFLVQYLSLLYPFSPDVYDERLCVWAAHELVGLEAEAHPQVAHSLHHRLLEEPLVALDPHAVVVPGWIKYRLNRDLKRNNFLLNFSFNILQQFVAFI